MHLGAGSSESPMPALAASFFTPRGCRPQTASAANARSSESKPSSRLRESLSANTFYADRFQEGALLYCFNFDLKNKGSLGSVCFVPEMSLQSSSVCTVSAEDPDLARERACRSSGGLGQGSAESDPYAQGCRPPLSDPHV